MTDRLRTGPAPSLYPYGEKPAAAATEARARLIDPDAFRIGSHGGYWRSRRYMRQWARVQAKAGRKR